MIIDLDSPIELRGYEIMHDDSGAARAYIDLFNLSDDTVSAYAATVRWSRDGTEDCVNDYVSVDSIAIPGGALFKLVLSSGGLKYADRIEMYFSRVGFENGAVWEPKDGDLVDVGEFKPLEGEALEHLKQIAGEDAYIFPETQDNFWRCVCGRINPLEADQCMRCRRERNYVLTELNRKAVDLNDEEREMRQHRQRHAAQARTKPTAQNSQTDKYLLWMLAVIAVFLAVSVTILII